MPLALVCGLPCSGKTARAEALKAHLEARGHTVLLVNEESLGVLPPSTADLQFPHLPIGVSWHPFC